MKNKQTASPKLIYRFLSVCIDFILFGIGFFILNSYVFNNVFETRDDDLTVLVAQAHAGVLIPDEDNTYHQLNSNKFEDYQPIIENYYLTNTYFGSDFYVEHGGTREKFTIEEYNEKILELGTEYTYFEYQYDENGEIDPSVIGVIKQEYYIDNDRNNNLKDNAKNDLLTFYTRHYRNIFEDLYSDEYYSEARARIVQSGVYQSVCSLIVPYVIVYMVPPITNKYGYTLGRFILKIGVINFKGIYAKRYLFLIRNLPMLILIFLIFFIDDIFILAPIYGCYFLFNWLATLMNQQNASILDFISLTRVCLVKESTIYENEEDIPEETELEN